jgi:PAS domain S-box-containing protein
MQTPAARTPLQRYAAVALAIGAALALRLLLWQFLGPELPFLLLWPAVMFCGWYGGLGPGLLATFLSVVVADSILVQPFHRGAAGPIEWLGLALFVLLGVFVSLLNDKLHRARQRSEKNAREVFRQREWFRVTLASIGDAVIATDPDGRVVFLNGVARSLTGWTPAEAAGQPLEQVFHVVHEQTRQPVPSPAERVLQSGTVVSLANHTLILGKHGTETPIADSAAPIRGEAGNILGVVLVFRDVTERKRAEEALQAADRHKDEFLAMLAHELRNPLAPVRNAVALLRLGGTSAADRCWAAEVIERQVRHLSRLVDDLLDVSRIRRGKIRLQKQPVALAEVVAQAVETSRPLIEAHRHHLDVQLPPGPVLLEADPTRLAQVLSNLINNAAKYTPDGGRIRLAAAVEGGAAVVRVADTGIGIPAEMLPKVFDLFTQVDHSLDRAQGGLGLGLALVQKLVELHGGSVEAHSDGPDKGSEFVVRLPLPAEAVHVQPRPEQVSPVRSATRRVLVVDDNADAVASLALLLRLAGHEVRTAGDGPAALELAPRFRPEAVLLDIGLPGMDGYEVARRLRALPELKDVLLMALTGYGQEEDRRRAREAGFDHYLTKPVEPAALQRLLGGAPEAPAPPAVRPQPLPAPATVTLPPGPCRAASEPRP